ncbi:PAS domain S-box-containing protein [Reichenbachiella faecimaris]|uniref:Sensory/regulatory protein RpfC n=1 Tax=Reichenbachiella faecimaris TaxID=692418 RepID=A0A1W2GH64_REIFA|nr:response regulator [Reichenbachiella faecimaris]SMD36005.1 PAS domain S-box-containing protein [Reichenbachiella faecimaris]
MKTKLLLIEDDKIDQKAFERFANREMTDCIYEIAGSVTDAKKSLEEGNYDVVITDFSLGDGDAFDLLTETKEIPVIFVSGAGNEEVVIEAMKNGASDFLIKDSVRNYLKVLPLVIQKILEQRRSKQKLQEAEIQIKKLSHVSRQTINPVIIFDRNKKIEWVNEAFINLTGYSSEEIYGMSAGLFSRKEGPFDDSKVARRVVNLKKSYTYESICYGRDGSEYWTDNSLSPILDEAGEIINYVIVQTNITEKKKTEMALREAKEAALQSEKAKEHFLANMSHEIRTPLNSIVGFTDLLLQEKTSAKQREYLDAVKWSSGNLLGIINDILDMSKIESGKIELEKTEMNLKVLAESCAKSLSVKVPEMVELNVDVDASIPVCLEGDPIRMNQILTNLLNNSLKFTERGEVRLAIHQKSINRGQSEITFVVTDTGIGIPADKLGEIFETFIQASSETTRKYGGTGLGLPIVKELVALHGGEINVESEEGKGSKFEFTIKLDAYNKPEKKKDERAPSFMKLDQLRLLIVEDHPLNQLLIKTTLQRQNINFDLANNGKEAITMVNETDYDLILMDIHMPEMGGIKTTQVIRNLLSEPKRSVPILAMTASAMRNDLEACLECGMNDYIPKPFKVEELFAKIQQWTNVVQEAKQDVA